MIFCSEIHIVLCKNWFYNGPLRPGFGINCKVLSDTSQKGLLRMYENRARRQEADADQSSAHDILKTQSLITGNYPPPPVWVDAIKVLQP